MSPIKDLRVSSAVLSTTQPSYLIQAMYWIRTNDAFRMDLQSIVFDHSTNIAHVSLTVYNERLNLP